MTRPSVVQTRQVAVTGLLHLAPASLRVPLAIAQFGALALVARAAGELAFGVVIFSQTAVRLGAAVALRGAGPMILELFSHSRSRESLEMMENEIRSARGLVFPIGLLIGVLEFWIFGLSLTVAALATAFVIALLWSTTAVRALAEATKGAGSPLAALAGELMPGPLVIVGLLAVADFSQSGAVGGAYVVCALALAQWIGIVVLRFRLRGLCAHSCERDDHDRVSTTRVSRVHLGVSTVFTLSLPLVALGTAAVIGDPEAVGHLSAALRLLAPATIVISGISAGLLPKIVHERTRQSGSSSLRWSWVLVACLSLPYTALLLLTPEVIEWVYGSSFADLATTVRIIAFGQLLNGLTGVAVEVLQVTGRADVETRLLSIATSAGVLAALLGTFLLELSASSTGALLFTAIIGIRSIAAGVHVYRPLLPSQPETHEAST